MSDILYPENITPEIERYLNNKDLENAIVSAKDIYNHQGVLEMKLKTEIQNEFMSFFTNRNANYKLYTKVLKEDDKLSCGRYVYKKRNDIGTKSFRKYISKYNNEIKNIYQKLCKILKRNPYSINNRKIISVF